MVFVIHWHEGFTCIPHPDPPSHLPLHPIPLGLPSAPGPSTCLMHPTWAGDLFHPRQYTCYKISFKERTPWYKNHSHTPSKPLTTHFTDEETEALGEKGNCYDTKARYSVLFVDSQACVISRNIQSLFSTQPCCPHGVKWGWEASEQKVLMTRWECRVNGGLGGFIRSAMAEGLTSRSILAFQTTWKSPEMACQAGGTPKQVQEYEIPGCHLGQLHGICALQTKQSSNPHFTC